MRDEYGTVLRFRLPLPMNLANSRMGWRAKLGRQTKWMTDGAMWAMAGSKCPEKPLRRARVHHHWYVRNKMDPDNCFARLKWPLDLLRNMGYLADDREDNVILMPPEQTIDRKDPRLEIVLEAA